MMEAVRELSGVVGKAEACRSLGGTEGELLSLVCTEAIACTPSSFPPCPERAGTG